MKKALTFLSVFALALLFTQNADAQIKTGKGDFFNITRTIEQTADSVTFIADTLTLSDNGGGLRNFSTGDSVAIFFVQNRFKIVNNMISQSVFDYVRVRISTASPNMQLRRQTYNGVVTNTAPIFGNDAGAGAGTGYQQSVGREIGLRPVYRRVEDIASSSPFNSDENAVRQFLTFELRQPTTGVDGIQIRNIFFKPNINNLTGLALPPDTTKDTLRAYHLDGSSANPNAIGTVIPSNDQWSLGTDLAIVRLLPGTTRYLVWVKDSAQAVDAGEYLGSFGDYSRGRYFLGDDGLPFDATNTAHQSFRPGALRAFDGSPDPAIQNPDYGMMIDGLPPERNPLRLTNLYQALAPAAFSEAGWYINLNPNPVNGLIPPYRAGVSNVAANPYQPGLVTSALDTLRFMDAYGNRTWDRMTQPVLKALSYTRINNYSPEDATIYLKGQTAADDTLRQFGQIVYRRLAYTHADVCRNGGGVEDSVRIIADATVMYTGLGGLPQTLAALTDTSGGFPRTAISGGMANAYRQREEWLDNQQRVNGPTMFLDGEAGNPNGYRFPVDPSGIASLPPTGVKIVVRPNIPRAIDITPNDQWKGTMDKNAIALGIQVVDGFGNSVDDNELFKYELSPFGQLSNGIPYRLNGVFDSLTNNTSPIQYWANNPANLSRIPKDTGRVYPTCGNTGMATSYVLRAASGSNNIGPYRIRVRSTYSFPDRGSDVNDPNKLDLNPGVGFAHSNFIPDGSPNNTFGIWFGPGTGYNAKLGARLAQTTAMDSTDVVWDGQNWTYWTGRQPRIELVIGRDESFVVGRTGNYRNPIFNKLYIRLTDLFGNPMDIAPFFYPNTNKVFVELPENTKYLPVPSGAKRFHASVSANVALSGAGGIDNPDPVADPVSGNLLEALLVKVPAGPYGLNDPSFAASERIVGDIGVNYDYNVVRFFMRAPQNISMLSLAGTAIVPLRAHLKMSTIPGVGDFSVVSAIGAVSVIPDVVAAVEVFKSTGKPQGTTVPLGDWGPGTVSDRTAAGFPTGTPSNGAESSAFYQGYFFRSTGADVQPSTAQEFPSVLEPMGYSDKGIGAFQASVSDLDHDATCPIPMDTVVVSNHTNQVRVVARLLDRFQNPIGGRLVKFYVESETLPVTPPKTQLQDNTQRGGFGRLGNMGIFDDTLKRTTIGDTAQAGWVSVYFISGRVGWQMVRIAMTPDTLAFDLSSKGSNLGEGTPVGPSFRGFAPRVIIPIYQKSDTTVRVEIFPYTAAATSPIPLPVDLITLQAIEHPSNYTDAGTTLAQIEAYQPKFFAYSANPLAIEQRATHYGRVANTNIRPYIPDTLNLTSADPTNPNTITAGRTVTLLAREYDQFGNFVDNFSENEDTARVRFRMWGDNWGAPPQPYASAGAGTIVPSGNMTRDEFGPMRKARYRHTKVGNLVAGVHINQTSYFTALEFPTPKLANATVFFEATATAVLPGQGPVNIHRDTCKVVSVTKNPTRFDVLRAGQDYVSLGPGAGTPGQYELNGNPENTTFKTPPVVNIGLPQGADPQLHSLTDNGLDNILLSQVYKRNVSPFRVGKYLVVDDGNVPLDKDGDPLFTTTGAVNPDFELDPYSNRPVLQKLDAYNNLNPQTSPNDRYNNLNGATNITGARRDGTIFDVTMAGGGDGIGGDTYTGSVRPVLVRVTPIWENNPPTGGAAYDLSVWQPGQQPGQTLVYGKRLYADTIYTYTGAQSPLKAATVRAEVMGTYSDFGNPGHYKLTGEGDRVTRIGIGNWTTDDYNRAGLQHRTNPPLNQFRTRFGIGISGGQDAAGNVLGDMNRRAAFLFGGFGRETSVGGNTNLTFAPGAFLRIVDSTAEQVLDVRVVDPSLTDMAGKFIDDTASYDQGKLTVTRRANRTGQNFFHLDDTYYDVNVTDIMGPNFSIGRISELPLQRTNRATHGLMVNATRQFFGQANTNKLRHTFVVVPYRIAFTSIFPSSYDVTANTFDKSTLPVGILPVQADIDTLPRVSPMFYPDVYGHTLGTFEIYSRLYGQIKHGATEDIPNNVGTPYARPDTIFRDQWYTYAVTPYDRYGNLNVRDSIYVNVGARHTTWEFMTNMPMGASGNLEVTGGGRYFQAKPVGFPQNAELRQDSLILYNLSLTLAGNRNDYLGMKPDDKRLLDAVGERSGNPIPNGLLPANAIAVRPVSIKQPFAPAPFLLSAGIMGNTSLFRMDHVGRCLDQLGQPVPFLSKDFLRLNWQASTWKGNQQNQNNPNDTVRYEVGMIIDSVYGVPGTNLATKSLTVTVLADNEGKTPSLTLAGDQLWNLIFRPTMIPQPNNPDSVVMRVKWFVRAFSKIDGLETYSDTAGVTVRDNPQPTQPLVISINRLPDSPPNAVQPTNGQTVFVDGTAPFDVLWTASSDLNNRKGARIAGGAAPGPFMLYNSSTRTWELDPSRTVDTLTYQWVGTVVSTSPVGKGAPLGAMLVKNAGTSTGIQLSTAELDALFGGFSSDPNSTSADSVKVIWSVFVKDFNVNDDLPLEQVEFPYKEGLFVNPADAINGDSSRWSFTSCQPHWIKSNDFRVNLTKLKNGGVEIDPIATSQEINALVGEEVCFTLTARDENGNIIRDWDSPSKNSPATILKINNSTANTDTSSQSWNSDPQGYTWAVITKDGTVLTQVSPDEFSIPASAFVNGVAVICIRHSKAEKGVQIEVTPTVANLNQLSAKMNFTADEIKNYLVELTPAAAKDQVYLLRRYEIIVSPRDRYLNVVSDREIRTRFTARFPGEFDQNQPGLSDIFAGEVFIKGTTNYFLASRLTRVKPTESQWVRAYASLDGTINGETAPYEILDHAPNQFALQTPADQTEIKLQKSTNLQQFTWVKATPQDPYTNIQISRFDPTTYSDVVTYKIKFVDAVSLTRAVVFDSDKGGMDATFTTNEGQLAGLIDEISGLPTTKAQECVWMVEATDGLYTTLSSPPTADPQQRPGYRLLLTKDGILGVEAGTVPNQFVLEQNYPNPFNPSTQITYALPKSSQVRVVVYDLLGTEVKTLVNGSQDAGTYHITWDATNNQGVQVPSGNYILKMVSGSFTQTRKMTLLK